MTKSDLRLAYLAWVVALSAILGSLYFSEVRAFAPCILCWFQRIFMYPLGIVILVGIIQQDVKMPNYALPLSLAGTAVAFYHNLLYYHVISEALAPCTLGVSCITPQITWLGFIGIPLLSLAAFAVIDGALFLIIKNNKKQTHA